MASALVETIALVPKAPVVGYAGQFEGHETAWDQANVRTIGRLEVNAKTDATGNEMLPLPQRQIAEPPIQAQAQALQLFDAGITSTTGVPNPILGNSDPAIRSNKMLRNLLDQGQKGNSNYLNNVIRSAHYEAKIVNDLLKIYARPGRLLRIVTGHEQTESVLVNQPFVKNDQGMPVPFDSMQHQGQEPKTLTLTPDAEWNIAINVTKDYDTRRQQEASELATLLEADPALMAVYGDLFFKYQDGPGHEEMAERAKVMLAPPVQKLLSGGQELPPEVQAAMAQAQQETQMLQQELQKLQFEKQAKVVETQGKIEVENQDNASRERIAMIQASAQLAATDAKLNAENARTFVEALESRIGKMLELHMAKLQQAHETGLAKIAELHAAGDQGREHAQDVTSQLLDHSHERDLQLAEHAHKETLAAMKPEPTAAP